MLKLADLPYALFGNEPENVSQRAYSHFYYYPPAARFAKINLGCTEQEWSRLQQMKISQSTIVKWL